MIIALAVENDRDGSWIILRGKLEGVRSLQVAACVGRVITADEDNVLASNGIDVGWRYVNQWPCDVKDLSIGKNIIRRRVRTFYKHLVFTYLEVTIGQICQRLRQWI